MGIYKFKTGEEFETADQEEVNDFIRGLFDTKEPEIDPSWVGNLPDVKDLPKGATVATDAEVKDFISGLFKK